MPKNSSIEKMTRFLIVLLGVGIGAALAALLLVPVRRFFPGVAALPYFQYIFYFAFIIIFAVLFYVLSSAVYTQIMKVITLITNSWSEMPTRQIFLTACGMVVGLMVAALVAQLIMSAGASLITISSSALVYVIFGYIGIQIGNRRYHSGKHIHGIHRHSKHSINEGEMIEDGDPLTDIAQQIADNIQNSERTELPAKVFDSSALIDGRVIPIYKSGFLEGKIIIPRFVLLEMQHLADNTDALRRAKGRRGLDTAAKLQELSGNLAFVDETDYPDPSDVDRKLLRLCMEKGAALVTNDYNLNKVASMSNVRVLNVNDLAIALKPVLQAGDTLTVSMIKEGREPGQGVAYLDDGTMIVVEDGREYIGQNLAVTVTSVLQTSAGRMVFAKTSEE